MSGKWTHRFPACLRVEPGLTASSEPAGLRQSGLQQVLDQSRTGGQALRAPPSVADVAPCRGSSLSSQGVPRAWQPVSPAGQGPMPYTGQGSRLPLSPQHPLPPAGHRGAQETPFPMQIIETRGSAGWGRLSLPMRVGTPSFAWGCWCWGDSPCPAPRTTSPPCWLLQPRGLRD